MIETQLANLIQTALGALALSCLWFFCWRRWAIDAFRQELFEARDRLFDVALNHRDRGFGFETPAYGQLRAHLNATIRFAHRLSTVQVVIFRIVRFICARGVAIDAPLNRPNELLGDVDSAIQGEATEIVVLWRSALLRFLLRTSPLFYFLCGFSVLRHAVSALFRGIIKEVSVWKNALRSAVAPYSAAVWAEIAIEEAMKDAHTFEESGASAPV